MGSKRYLSRLERRAEYFVSPRDEALPRVSLECNPEIPVVPGEEHYVLDKSLDEVYFAPVIFFLRAASVLGEQGTQLSLLAHKGTSPVVGTDVEGSPGGKGQR